MRKVIVSYLLCRYLIFFFFTRQKMSSDNVVDFKTEFKGLEKLKTIEIQLAVERAHRGRSCFGLAALPISGGSEIPLRR